MSVVGWEEETIEDTTPEKLCWTCIRALGVPFNTEPQAGACTRCGFTTEIYKVGKDEVN